VVDDVVQETFAQAYRCDLHVGGDPVRAFKLLAGIARNRSIDVLRRRMRGVEEVRDDGRLVTVAAVSHDADPEVVLLASRRRDGIAEALDSLCDRQRRILFMHYIDGRRYEEIAEEEGITVDAVKAALARGRRSFRHLYASIADRDGLAVVLGGLLGRAQARLRAMRDRVAAGAESLAGGITSVSPTVANAFVAVVVAGSVSLAGASAAAAEGGDGASEPAGSSVPAAGGDDDLDLSAGAGSDTDAGADDSDDGTTPGQGASPGQPGGGENGSGVGPSGPGGGGGGSSDPSPSSPGSTHNESEAGADTEEYAPGSPAKAKAKAKNETEADPEEGSAMNSLDAMAEATVDLVESTTQADNDTSVGCPEETEATSGDPTEIRPSGVVCPVVTG
jgi:RNA polymerase sigma factor (sigma-70 family)